MCLLRQKCKPVVVLAQGLKARFSACYSYRGCYCRARAFIGLHNMLKPPINLHLGTQKPLPNLFLQSQKLKGRISLVMLTIMISITFHYISLIQLASRIKALVKAITQHFIEFFVEAAPPVERWEKARSCASRGRISSSSNSLHGCMLSHGHRRSSTSQHIAAPAAKVAPLSQQGRPWSEVVRPQATESEKRRKGGSGRPYTQPSFEPLNEEGTSKPVLF